MEDTGQEGIGFQADGRERQQLTHANTSGNGGQQADEPALCVVGCQRTAQCRHRHGALDIDADNVGFVGNQCRKSRKNNGKGVRNGGVQKVF